MSLKKILLFAVFLSCFNLESKTENGFEVKLEQRLLDKIYIKKTLQDRFFGNFKEQKNFTRQEKKTLYIIIDDVGNDSPYFKEYLKYELPLTFSVLPKLTFSKEYAMEIAKQFRHDVILHMPMEPLNEKLDAGPGKITINMSEEEVISNLEEDINSLGVNINGINNHMGSKITQNEKMMNWIIKKLKEKNLFFLDSYTIAHTALKKVSYENQTRVEQRDIFLDNEDDYFYINGMLNKLLDLADKRGYAIGIGHVQSRYLIRVLQDRANELSSKYKLSLLSELYNMKIRF